MAENNTTVDILNDLKPNSDKYRITKKLRAYRNRQRQCKEEKRYSKIR